MGRNCYPDTWVEYTLRVARTLLSESHASMIERPVYSPQRGLYYNGTSSISPVSGVAISDARFKNEIDAIHAAGGVVVRMLRGTGLPGAAGQHRSETEQQGLSEDHFDFVIDNREWTHEELFAHLSDLATNHLSRRKKTT